MRNDNDFAKAISFLEEEARALRELRGTHDIHYAWTLACIADTWERNQRYREAKSALESAVPAYRAALNESHPIYVERLQQLAACNLALGVYDEAERQLHECEQVARKLAGDEAMFAEDERIAAQRHRNLAHLYEAHRRFPEAEAEAERAEATFTRFLPEGYENCAECLWLLAVARSRQNKHARAFAASSRAIQLIETFGCAPRRVPYSDLLEQHATSLRELNRGDWAARFESQARELRAAKPQSGVPAQTNGRRP